MIHWLLTGTVFFVMCGSSWAQAEFRLTITGGKHDAVNVPVSTAMSIAKEQLKFLTATAKDAEGRAIRGQFTGPTLATEGVSSTAKDLIRRDFHFTIPQIKANEKQTLTFRLDSLQGRDKLFILFVSLPSFNQAYYQDWILMPYGGAKAQGRTVVRYWNASYDPSTPEKRDRSYKVFHHVFAPDGRLVTNGGHTDRYDDPKTLLYPHHRGLMYGFNKCSYGPDLKKKADTWHCTGDAHQAEEKSLKIDEGPLLGRHRVLLGWHGEKKDLFAKEEREVTVYNLAGGTLVDFASRLKPVAGPVKLDGDPQHAGFQFRAHNDVATKTAKQTYYLRPDGKDEPGKTRNWPEVKSHSNLPWNAMSFVLDGKRYTAVYLNHPKNPGEQRYSERDYGRFGCYFEHDLTEDRPLVVNYRLWLQEGEMTVEQAAALSRQFVDRPKATIK